MHKCEAVQYNLLLLTREILGAAYQCIESATLRRVRCGRCGAAGVVRQVRCGGCVAAGRGKSHEVFADFRNPPSLLVNKTCSPKGAAEYGFADLYDYPAHYDPRDGEEFDFIVVGAGTAGCVVANRLTEVTGWRVLLIEAGGDPTNISDVPALLPLLQRSEIDWQYKTEPSNLHCLGMEGNRCNWPRGKVLGGSSTINYMVYVRGNPRDFDAWADEGNVGWGYKDILPYFKKSEDMRAEAVLASPDFHKYHNIGGYQKVETFQNYEVRPLATVLGQGVEELGYCYNVDCNGRNQIGFTPKQGSLQNGRRCSTAKAFLSPISKRSNLKVSKNSLAVQVLIDEKTKTAFGIKFINKYGKIITVRAKREVILSGGAVNSPQLLMLSGIGPRRNLQELGIKVVQDLPVGENLQDHYISNTVVMSLNYTKPELELNVSDVLSHRQSLFSSLGLASVSAYINTVKPVCYPDIDITFADFNKNDSIALLQNLNNFGYRNEIKTKYLELNLNSFIVLIYSFLLKPYSKGNITLRSKDPKEYPKLNPGYFSDPRDLETFFRLYEFLEKLSATRAIRKVNAIFHELDIPSCEMFPFASRRYRECALRHLSSTGCHPCGTVKMGPAASADSVVDPHLRVKGVNKLRVIDASIMPSIVRANINAAVLMIAEKGSDLIKKTWL
ncbi:hypothetical protein J6590_090751 [Homalodisca vitripennis]|nr:hypothetical protein J6590_053043 [Homalodisca vitripennis]KAG8314539.1 hypothetical protein J6590_090751 [Homalodisca vitripennis]